MLEKTELFVRIPISVLLDERVSRSALIVYAVLIDAADKYGVRQGCTIAESAQRAGIAEKTVRRSEAQLVAAGYISVHRTGRASCIEVLHNLRPTIRSSVEVYNETPEEGTA